MNDRSKSAGRRWRLRWAAGALLLACAGAGPDERLPLRLDRMTPQGPVRPVPGADQNVSGIAYSPVSGTFFVVTNSPCRVVELTAALAVKRAIRLDGFSDTEGIAHVEGTTFAIAEEGRGRLVLIDLGENAERVELKAGKIIPVEETGGNMGLEGVAYDPVDKCFYVVKEKNPRKIYRVDREGRVDHRWDAETSSLGLRDLSDIAFDPVRRHLVLLSDESATAVECDLQGREVSRLRVGLRQAEGIVLGPNGRIYVCGEPSEIRVFQRAKE